MISRRYSASGMSRRALLRAGAAGVTGAMVPVLLGAHDARAAGATGPAARNIPLNADWRFGPFETGSTEPGFDDSALERVTLPHTVTRLSWRQWDPATWERAWIYRRHFEVPPTLAGLRLFADFGAAMTGSTVALNGHELGVHLGGYLPFDYEITDQTTSRGNLLAVALDSTFNINVPPNRAAPAPTTSVDFWQPGGIYRPVSLRAVPQVFLADVFAKPVDVLDSSRRVDVQCTVDAGQVPPGEARVHVALLDNGRVVSEATTPVTIGEPGRVSAELRLENLGDITLWDVDRPRLYDMVATLSVAGEPIHDYALRIGFRSAVFTKEGFFLNGERLQLFGLNRHQFYPFAGGAMPARVQRRDAEILRRELNCNMVRCSHYPQSEAFLDACDELGLLVFEEVPGWGRYIGDEEWKEYVVRDVGEMVVRDRNHPSIVIWGARLNETNDDVELFTRTRDLAHSLDDSRPTTGAMIGGLYDSPNFVQDVFSMNDYRRDGNGEATLRPPRTDRPYLVTEAVGTLSGPARFYRRTDPVADQQGQAYAHARVHEVGAADARYCGVVAWCGYDYPSGTGNQWQGIKTPGVIDLFRVPKPGATIYQSQLDPAVRPVIEPAFYWDFGASSPANGPGPGAMICSNCDRLELFVDNAPFATVLPDRERFGHLHYPPSFVDLTVDGSGHLELRIDGYVADRLVASRSFSSDPSGDVLAVTADDAELIADGADATRVVFRALDRYGAARPYVAGDVTIAVDGPATLLGESPFPFAETGGVGAVWVRTRDNAPGEVRVAVSHPRLGTGTVDLTVRQAPPGGVPPSSVDFAVAAAPRLVAPGSTTRVTATVRNLDQPALRDVEVSLAVPDGWSRTARTPTRFAALAPGQSVETAWEVTAPAGVTPGEAPATARTTYEVDGRYAGAHAAVTLVTPTTLAAAYGNVGTTDDVNFAAGDLDGVGNTYSRQALAAAGLSPGAEVVAGGVRFTWPDVGPGQPDNVLANAQTITMSGAGATLGMLGAGSRGRAGGTGMLHFDDGTSQTFSLHLDDWFFPPRPDNEVVAKMTYLNADNGRADNGVGGRRTHDVYVFFAGVPLPPDRRLVGVTLPKVGATVEGGVRALHIFALGLG